MKATIDAASFDDYACVYNDISVCNPLTVYIRAHNVKFDQVPAANTEDMRFLAFQGQLSTEGVAFAGIYNDNGTVKWFIKYHNGADFVIVLGNEVSINTNYDMELGFYYDGVTGWCKLWINGDLECEATDKDTDLYAPNYAMAGFVYSDAPDSYDAHVLMDCIYIDDDYGGPEA